MVSDRLRRTQSQGHLRITSGVICAVMGLVAGRPGEEFRLSSYMVIPAVSDALRQILWDGFRNDRRIARHIQSREEISLRNPTEAVRDSAHRLSVWLYSVSQNEFVRNENPPREAKSGTSLPLTLNLHYLVTPLSANGELDLMVIGKVLQIFSDIPAIVLASELDDIHEELHILLARTPPDEMSRIWEALKEPYRLSLCYQIRAVRINSASGVPAAARVVDRFAGIGFNERPK